MNTATISAQGSDVTCSGTDGTSASPNTGCTAQAPVCKDNTCVVCYGSVAVTSAASPDAGCTAQAPVCKDNTCVVCEGSDGNSVDYNEGCPPEKPTCNSGGTECQCTGLGIISGSQISGVITCTVCNTGSGTGTTDDPHTNGCDASSPLCYDSACIVCTDGFGDDGNTLSPHAGCTGLKPTCKDGSCQCLGTVDPIAGKCDVCTPSISSYPNVGCTASLPACENDVCKVCYGSGGDTVNPDPGCSGATPVCLNGDCKVCTSTIGQGNALDQHAGCDMNNPKCTNNACGPE